MTETFDWNRPFTTRDGKAAEDVQTLDSGDRRVRYRGCAAVEYYHDSRGRFLGSNRELDLINIPAAAPPAIDWGKPLRTRKDKWPAKLAHELLNGTKLVVYDHPIEGETWKGVHADGRLCKGLDSRYDLENVPPEPVKHRVWVNVYLTGESVGATAWRSRAAADSHAAHVGSNMSRRIACFEREIVEGEGLE